MVNKNMNQQEIVVSQLIEIKNRYLILKNFIESNNIYDKILVEVTAIQFRRLLENIASYSTVLHQTEYENIIKKIEKEYNPKDIFEEIKKHNPRYYPNPQKKFYKNEEGLGVIEGLQDESLYLKESDFNELYNLCGDIMHHRHPNRNNNEHLYKKFYENMTTYLDQIFYLIGNHTIALYTGDKFSKRIFYITMNFENKDLPVIISLSKEL